MHSKSLWLLVTGLSLPLLSSSCATNTGKGALIGGGGGAAVGAGIGALAGGGKGALIGAAVGAGVGAGTGALIGRYMDKQEAELRKMKAAQVQRQGDKLVVRFKSEILFATNKSALKPRSKSDLAEFAQVLKSYPDTDLVVEGHTDSTGTKARNQKLSMDRAQSVVECLAADGVDRRRMVAQGYADERPVGDNKTAKGREQNRRVEIQIAANEKLQQQQQAAQ
jgi:outer membrane protein OmpA-like peptidoglycan-associated protein